MQFCICCSECNENTKNLPSIDLSAPNQFYICVNCKRYDKYAEKIIKLIWYPLCKLSDGRHCESGIENASLWTWNVINNMHKYVNNDNIKIYDKMLVRSTLLNEIQLNDATSAKYHDTIENILQIHENNNKIVIFLCVTQKRYLKFHDSHQVTIFIKNKDIYLVDSDTQQRNKMHKYIKEWRKLLGENKLNYYNFKYIGLNFNCYATYIAEKESKKLAFLSGFCIANSCFIAMIIATYYKDLKLLDKIYQHCKYIKYLLNDPLIVYFANTWWTTFVLWAEYDSFKNQWMDYWLILNGKKLRSKFVKDHARMFCVYLWTNLF